LAAAEINSASSITAFWASGQFDLTESYFLIAGIAGVNPEVATLGSVAFARFAVQVALQYEFDMRDLSANWSTGYIPFGSTVPSQYPSTLYGTGTMVFDAI
jgi:purine nucleoside permease